MIEIFYILEFGEEDGNQYTKLTHYISKRQYNQRLKSILKDLHQLTKNSNIIAEESDNCYEIYQDGYYSDYHHGVEFDVIKLNLNPNLN